MDLLIYEGYILASNDAKKIKRAKEKNTKTNYDSLAKF